MWGRDGGVYAMFSLCRCLFCLSKQHMQQQQQQQQQSLLRKGTSRRGRRQFFIYQFQLSSLGFWEFNHLLQYKLLAELLLADKKGQPQRGLCGLQLGSLCWLCLLSAPNWQRQTLSPHRVWRDGGKAWKMSHKMQIKTQVSFELQPFASLPLCLCLCASLSAAAFEFYASDDASAACGSHSVTGS